MSVILGVDQGTTATKVIAIAIDGEIVASSSVPVQCVSPRSGWMESDPVELWHSVDLAIDTCVAQLPAGEPVLGIGISNQRESVVVWDTSSGEPQGPCVSWQCQRGFEHCDEVAEKVGEERVRAISGLPLDPGYSAGKLRWLLDQVDTLEGLKAGTIDSWLAWKLTRGAAHACDMGNASRTQLFDISSGHWSSELLEAFHIPQEVLPDVVHSSGYIGECTSISACRGVPLVALCGDSHASLFAHWIHDVDALKATYGTGSSVLTAELSGQREAAVPLLARSVVWWIDEVTYGIEGNILAAGSALDWIGELLGCEDHESLEQLAAQAQDAAGMSFVPALGGLGAPHWSPGARGAILGISHRTRRQHLAAAAFEGVAHEVADVIEEILAARVARPSAIYVDGGASRSDRLVQLQADLTGVAVIRSLQHQASALGAAYLGGLALGTWSRSELGALKIESEKFVPALTETERVGRRAAWGSAVAACLARADSLGNSTIMSGVGHAKGGV